MQAGLPLAFMDADHKTVKRILAAMEARGVLKPPVTIDVPVAKSRLSLCRPRPVQVYCGPDCKLASNVRRTQQNAVLRWLFHILKTISLHALLHGWAITLNFRVTGPKNT